MEVCAEAGLTVYDNKHSLRDAWILANVNRQRKRQEIRNLGTLFFIAMTGKPPIFKDE